MIHRLVNVAKELAPDFEKRAPQWDRTRSYCWENVSQLVDAAIMGMSSLGNMEVRAPVISMSQWWSSRSLRCVR